MLNSKTSIVKGYNNGELEELLALAWSTKLYLYYILIVEMGRKNSESSHEHDGDCCDEEEEVSHLLFRLPLKSRFSKKSRD